MSSLDAIAIRAEGVPLDPETQNALPILNEIRHALAVLNETGQSTTIDLSAIPFGPGDREALDAALGQGEVSATIDSLGHTHIRETAFPGVWWVDYRSPSDTELVIHLEITQIPSLLATPKEEIADSLQRLEATLKPDQAHPEQEDQTWRTT
jgi:hydrogenase-1 operon protein HyaF